MAAIDCGTNSIRLLVADLPDPSAGPSAPLVDASRRMEIVRLGQGVDATGRLAPEAIERTRVALADYAAEIEKLGAERVRMCATSATRDAENAADFRTMVQQTLGVAPEVVSGDEEARLSFTGAVRGLPSDARSPYLVVDIGGGSTEFVVGSRDSGVDAAISMDIGCVRMTERHLHGDPPGVDEIDAAQADIAVAVDRALAVVPGREAATLVGLAGSVTTVVAIAEGLTGYDPTRIHHARVSYDRVAEVTAELLAADREQRLAIPVMHPGRADVIGAGALVLRVIMERAGMDSVVASEHDILDGIAWSLAQPVA
ncbi:Ppx/GppA phosphatase family protein [Micromonospora craniellae]|uniref:Ppx/GppA family phosphatase n=1 Tax=Micromonospora craniellae TaxID=2294034 RepID=A0A372FRA2_9ACTN|nr:Ppx/GppA phosphatase family protein [Micromonospora craniellae]QOC94936.1 Ppx/GppA family phosphatase [Micromonospora craniellae]RFS43263.1 Ppx/GppA family phosphatase [Micromonospora craniellae]